MEKRVDEIRWHPGFYGAAELEFKQNKKDLEFEREYNLSKEPLRIDLLIIKKHTDVAIENEIGCIFRKFNILEYKSPDDEMSIDDYFKVIGYACFYKSLGTTVDEVPAEELTVSLFREAYPRELIKKLKELGATVEKKFPGIYYVKGVSCFKSQIVVIRQLDKETHSSLRVLSKCVTEEDVRRFLTETQNLEIPGDKDNVEAVLQVSILANNGIYEKIKEEMQMCEALERLMKNELDAKEAAGIAKGRAEGKEDVSLFHIRNLMESMKLTAEQAMDALQIPPEEQKIYAVKLKI
jgi:hypothetical protein